MASILTNSAAMKALREFRKYDNRSAENTEKIATGKKIKSGKDNAAYYSASTLADKQASALKNVHEAITLNKNALTISRITSEKFHNLSKEIQNNVALAASIETSGNPDDIAEIQKNIDGLVVEMKAVLDVSGFNGDSYIGTGNQTVITGFKTLPNGISQATTVTYPKQDLQALYTQFNTIDLTTAPDLKVELSNVEDLSKQANTSAATLGIYDKSLDEYKEMLMPLADLITEGASSLISADMEREAAIKASNDLGMQLAIQNVSLTGIKADRFLSLLGG